MKGAESYDDPAKDAWRGQKWNRIADAVTKLMQLPPGEKRRRCSEKTVIYLVGPDDHDRKRARARGFANHNLIAVDLVQDRIDEVRASGGLGIRGSLQQVLMHWPADWPVDVVDADLCGGLVNNTVELVNCLAASAACHENTIISLNLMRGRDSHSNPLRSCAKSFESSLNIFAEKFRGPEIVKHRGALWMISFYTMVCHLMHGLPPGQSGRKNIHTPIDLDDFENFVRCVAWPRISSYRSKTSGQWFDSVIHRWGLLNDAKAAIVKSGDRRLINENVRRISSGVSENLTGRCGVDESVRSRIAALRAVRSKYLQGAA